MNVPKCFNCKFLAYYDTGYEITATSSWAKCLKGNFDVEREEGETEINGIDDIADNCEDFQEGKPVNLGIVKKND